MTGLPIGMPCQTPDFPSLMTAYELRRGFICKDCANRRSRQQTEGTKS